MGLITPIFIGDKEKIALYAKEAAIELDINSIVHTASVQESAATAVKLIREGHADLLMKGMLTTKSLLVEVLNEERAISSGNLLSHLALFESPYYHKIIALSDAALNIAPNEEEKIQIVQNAVKGLNHLGLVCPKVALLAAIEKVNPKMQATVDAAHMVEIHAKSKIAECYLEGPLALDLAVSTEAATHKGIRSIVCGDADLLIVPEITSGNVLYKSFTCMGGAKTAGVILGASAPIILTSRADSEESKLYSIALAMNLN